MLANLYIQNFALIEKLHLNFEKGFTVITGETGSGKSILLGALHLILGERADYGVIRDRDQKTIVEATFVVSNFDFTTFFKENELDFQEETIVRREISAQGKSRAFINDTPVGLNVLREFSEKLIHIHSQHHTIELRDPQFQLEILDTLSGTLPLRKEFKAKLTDLKRINSELKELETTKNKMVLDADFNAFLVAELETLQLDKTNYPQLETDLKSIENSDDIKLGFGQLIQQFSNEGLETNVIHSIVSLRSRLDKLAGLHPELEKLAQRTKEVYIEILDIGEEALNQLESISVDPAEKEELTTKIDKYNTLLRKHNVTSQEELMHIWDNLASSITNLESIENTIQDLVSLKKTKEEELNSIADLLNKTRLEAIPLIEQQVVTLLDEVKLINAKVVFDLIRVDKFNDFGSNELKILFSPNKGMEPKSIDKAASGGELSRLMLVLQYMLSTKKQLPTIIFDEIDTGVSGEVAQRIGQILYKMGQSMQIFAITHLPQVAGKGQNHWKVAKSDEKGVTLTNVLSLNLEERVEEIARLMSGDNINSAALENAKALMN